MNGEPELLERYEAMVRSYSSEENCREAVSFKACYRGIFPDLKSPAS
jgi:hypothetical protein